MDLRKPLERVLNDADPKAGVGPRGLHVHYLQVLVKGNFSDSDTHFAFDLLASLGNLNLALGMPAWVRICLGGGLLTALNKVAPKEGTKLDARPVSRGQRFRHWFLVQGLSSDDCPFCS